MNYPEERRLPDAFNSGDTTTVVLVAEHVRALGVMGRRVETAGKQNILKSASFAAQMFHDILTKIK